MGAWRTKVKGLTFTPSIHPSRGKGKGVKCDNRWSFPPALTQAPRHYLILVLNTWTGNEQYGGLWSWFDNFKISTDVMFPYLCPLCFLSFLSSFYSLFFLLLFLRKSIAKVEGASGADQTITIFLSCPLAYIVLPINFINFNKVLKFNL